MAKLLSSAEIKQELRQLSSDWSLNNSCLERDFKFDDFKSALDFVNEVGQLAEEQNHHPDIKLGWGKASLSVTSHDLNGLSVSDFKLTKSIDQLIANN